MNHTYKVVWSRAKGALVVASELASSQGKASAKSGSVVAGAFGGASLMIVLSAVGVLAPLGGTASAQAMCSQNPCSGSEVYRSSAQGQIAAPFTFVDSAQLVGDIADVVANYRTVNLRDGSTATLAVENSLGANSGQIAAYDAAQINVDVSGAITGGTIHMNGQSVLSVNASGGINGGVQQIGANAELRLNASNAITGGEQHIQGLLSVQAADGISNTNQEISGGRMEVSATGAVSRSLISISDGGRVVVDAQEGFGEGVKVLLSAHPTLGEGVLDLQKNATVSALNGLGGIVENTGSGQSTLTVNTEGAERSSFGGDIVDGSGGIRLVKGGTGTLRLTGASSYTHGTEIRAGTLEGNTESLQGDILNNARLSFNQDSSGVSNASISGSGTVVVSSSNGAGVVHLTGVNTHFGGTEVSNATLKISDKASLGEGALSLNNGRLVVADDKGSRHVISHAINVTDTALLASEGSNSQIGMELEFSGPITGEGNLAIAQVGTSATTVRLTGINSYQNTVVHSGTLIGDSASIKGNVTNAGKVIFDQQSDGLAIGNMSGAGIFEKQGVGRLQLRGHSSVDWNVAAGVLAATAQQFTGDVSIDSGAGLAFVEAADFTYAGSLYGSGNVYKEGSGSLTFTGDSSDFLGRTTVRSGTLVVNTTGNDKLGGSVAVLDGGILKGTGRMGSTTIGNGGVIAPGNLIGTLTIDGDLSFSPTAVYAIEVDPASETSDRIQVTGTANLAGQVAHIGFKGSYSSDATYTILDAGAINGRFDAITSNFAFLNPTLQYDTTSVRMKLERNDKPIGGGAESGNGESVGDGVGSVGEGKDPGSATPIPNNIYDVVVVLPESEVATALEMLSGEIHASTSSALINSSRLARDVSFKHLRNHFDVAPIGKVRSDAATWVEVVGQSSTLKGGADASKANQKLAGLFLGGHADVGSGWRLGISLGYTDGKIEVNDKLSKADVKSYSALLSGGNTFDLGVGKLNVLAGASYSWHRIDTQRRVVFTGIDDRLNAKYRARTAQVFGEMGYAMALNESTIAEPFAAVALTSHQAAAFSEEGGLSALSGAKKRNAVTTSTLGIRSKVGFQLWESQGVISGSLGWRYASGDLKSDAVLSFAGGNPFTITGAALAKNAAVAELNANLGVSKNTSLGVTVSGQYGGGTKDTVGSVNLRVRF